MLKSVSLMTWKEVENLDKDVPFILPISALEQHGHHLPLGTDDLILNYLLNGLKGNDLLVPDFYLLPTVHYGNSAEHLDFPGTVSLSPLAVEEIVESVLVSLSMHGFEKLIIINSHGGNSALLQGMAQEWRRRFNMKVYNIDLWSAGFFEGAEDYLDTSVKEDIHAGEIETSLLQYFCHQLVREDEIGESKDVFFEIPSYNYCWNTLDISMTGVLGGASMGSKEKGEKIYNYTLDKLVDYLLEICDN